MKILIANRGEIAVRVMRACRDMRIKTVAVYSPSDRSALHVQYADEAVPLDADKPVESYLNIKKLIKAARSTGSDAVHPGYGFLAENAEFARECRSAGLVFIGPSADVIELMGGKTAAREAAIKAGVPVVPGSEGVLSSDLSDEELAKIAANVGYPLFVKAVAGGGGKGMRLVGDPDSLLNAIQAARSEAGAAFGNSDVYLERWVAVARHIEVQLLGDEHGVVVPFVERECSIQRRHQKVIEESPSASVSNATRLSLAAAAAALARGVGYTNAGTVEFLLDENEQFYFLEMNTRLQVEHPVTEMVTGVDLVKWQIRIANGEKLTLDPEKLLSPNGHAVECRVYAEDPLLGFIPCPGLITHLRVPTGPNVRDDSGVLPGFTVPVHYDSMVSKLITWGENRDEAIQCMLRALSEYEIGGVKTTIPLFRWILNHPDFVAGRFDTGFLDRTFVGDTVTSLMSIDSEIEELAIIAASIHLSERKNIDAVSEMRSRSVRSRWVQAARRNGLRD
ncbi:MAG: hypothetical protein CMM58_13670 [Rhodospirillaceae bacterium]|nr:hypothetical protein [Rhodospirillaceae bacterium]